MKTILTHRLHVVLLLFGVILIFGCQESTTVENKSSEVGNTDSSDYIEKETDSENSSDSIVDTDTFVSSDTMDTDETGPVELSNNSWLLYSLKEEGKLFELNPDYSYELDTDHPEFELNFLAFSTLDDSDSISGQGMFYRWVISVSINVESSVQISFNYVLAQEFPPFNLIEPLSEDFCPDECYEGKDVLERVLLSVRRYEINGQQLIFSNDDLGNEAIFQLSHIDLFNIPY